VDQKGGPAAFVTAGRILKELGFDKKLTIYFIGSVIEEDCDGLCWKYIVEEDKIRPDTVILTEPTNLNLYRGHRGRMEMHVHFYGRSSHGSAPERGVNAIYMASRAALEVEKLNERLAYDEFLGKGSITISEIISKSPSLCAVSDYARIHLDRRLTAGETKETAVKEIEEMLRGIMQKLISSLSRRKLIQAWSTEWRNIIRHGLCPKNIRLFRTVSRHSGTCSVTIRRLVNGLFRQME